MASCGKASAPWRLSLALPPAGRCSACAPRSCEGAIAYLAAAESGHAIAMADPTSPRLEPVAQTYQPAWILAPKERLSKAMRSSSAPLQTMQLLRRQSPSQGSIHPDFYLLLDLWLDGQPQGRAPVLPQHGQQYGRDYSQSGPDGPRNGVRAFAAVLFLWLVGVAHAAGLRRTGFSDRRKPDERLVLEASAPPARPCFPASPIISRC